MSEYRGREIPWLRVVQFHKEVVARAEEGFFSLNGRDDQAERWTSLPTFDPDDLAGPWAIDQDDIHSQPFRLTMEQGQHESLFLGGPCFLGWAKSMKGGWVAQWRPLLYREVELRANGGRFEIVPKQGTWSVTPLLHKLLDRLEVNIGAPLDQLAGRLLERAEGYRKLQQCPPLDRRIFRALFSEVPELDEELTKETRQDTFPVEPSPWVLFAPTSRLSAFTRHLMHDYERLEMLLQTHGGNIGGLRLLEDQAAPVTAEEVDVLPVIPLNESQRRAVQTILEGRPLTVISGPPGTGKSQVVVALLLNAWARGRSVLFASNNNKAVDVVRERVESFESEFPIAVRAGSKQKQNIQEVLRRTLNMASAAASESRWSIDPANLWRKRKKLLHERGVLQRALKSRLPQRTDEARKTALRAYGEYRSRLSHIGERESRLREEQDRLGFGSQSSSKVQEAAAETREWLERIDHFKELIRYDNERRSELQSQIAARERHRNRAVEEVGLACAEVGDWNWLITGPTAGLLSDWDQQFREVIGNPIEQALEPIQWSESFDRWRSAEDAIEWAKEARRFAEIVLRACAELAPKLESIRDLKQSVEERRAKIQILGVSEHVNLPVDTLRDWAASFAEYTTREQTRLDFLPWSQRSKLRRQLRRIEQRLRPELPLELWTRIGTLNDEGRQQLGPVVETTRRWLEVRREWQHAQALIEETDDRFRALRSQAAALRLSDIPSGQDTNAWRPIVGACEEMAAIADLAAAAWRRKAKKEAAEERLRSIAKEWLSLASGMPLRESWRRGQGKAFDEAVRLLADRPDAEMVRAARATLYTGALRRLIECWLTAAEHEEEAGRLRMDFLNIPEPRNRQESWWKERPHKAFVIKTKPRDWPNLDGPSAQVKRVTDWCERWRDFIQVDRPADEQKAEEELKWAVSKLGQAAKVLPQGPERTAIAQLYDKIKRKPEQDWPLTDLNDAFGSFSPDRIQAKIEGIEAELRKGSFEDAKARWLERLRNDDEAIRAVDGLEKSLRQYRGQIVESYHDTFRTVLRAVPIWITTAQASQAIPLESELFDIVVIDEASQCTLTNLLPLMYRGRTLAVIGDDNQLPAIPTIQEPEELALARKYEIEEHLALVGHATNDVYSTATESLPRRRADVVMLEEHFRSNPQIIGFSNRYIYLQRLELKKDPSWGERLPVGSGVHTRPVAGVARRGSNGRSWVNEPEAEAVLELIQQLREGDARSLSLGVVTPFRAQKEMLWERLDVLRLASEVLVDTAYGFQGDERDVIIFSPVVAKGITASASRWVETPPNLINVATTRAREVLFVVADFDYCLRQEGILRKLALYCRDIELLRKTGNPSAELELFSWMVVKGWEPKVHPRVGDIEVDFVLVAESGRRLNIEVMGAQHAYTQEQDNARRAYVQGRDYIVLEFSAREVLETPFEVIHRIDEALHK